MARTVRPIPVSQIKKGDVINVVNGEDEDVPYIVDLTIWTPGFVELRGRLEGSNQKLELTYENCVAVELLE